MSEPRNEAQQQQSLTIPPARQMALGLAGASQAIRAAQVALRSALEKGAQLTPADLAVVLSSIMSAQGNILDGLCSLHVHLAKFSERPPLFVVPAGSALRRT